MTNTASGLTEMRSYDTRGRLVSVSLSGSSQARTTQYVYDNADRLRMTEDAQGNRSYSFYDAAGRLEYTVDASGAVSRYEYTATGQLTSQTQYATRIGQAVIAGWYEGGERHGDEGDAHGRRRCDGGPRKRPGDELHHDAAGRLETTTDAANTLTMTLYDGLSRLAQADGGYHNVALFYDSVSKLTRIVNMLNLKMFQPKMSKSGTMEIGIDCTAMTFAAVEIKVETTTEPKATKKVK